MSVKMSLLLICCICWTITYVECIRVGFKYKIHAMPFFALALNITWEAYNTYQGAIITGWLHMSTLFDAIWFILDCLILYTYFAFGKRENFAKISFYLSGIGLLIMGFIFQHFFATQFGFIAGALYSSSLIGVAMSVLFIKMYFDRKGNDGQLLSIAINKCVGTLSATLLVGWVGVNKLGGAYPIVLYIGLFIFVIDLIYIFLLYSAKNAVIS